MIKRFFDLIIASILLTLLLPVFLLISIWIKAESGGSVFFKQKRSGLNGKLFSIYKFRTMHKGSDKKGLLTIGAKDKRITKSGAVLRKAKLDELPQLINVIKGDMSLVGPRPEVKKYTDLYNTEQKKVLSVKPGITDYASIKYANENEILEKYEDPEEAYIKEIMPDKLRINLEYIKEKSFKIDILILLKTLKRLVY